MYAFERLNFKGEGWLADIHLEQNGTIYQTPDWLRFISRTQKGELVVAALKEGDQLIGYFTGLIVNKLGFRILGSPFPGWSTDYMGFVLSEGVDRRRAVQALMDFTFQELGCVHLEMMDRNLTLSDLDGLGVECRIYRGFEIDLTRDEKELLSNMTSACRRCIRKAEKEGVMVEEAHDSDFADDYYSQLEDVFAKQNLFPPYRIDRVRQLYTEVYPTGHLLLLRALDRGGRCIATAIFPHFNGVMYFWGGASWREFQILRPNEVLQWYGMKFGKQTGIHTYDMGGGGEYKRKYGGKEIEVPWFRISKYPWIRFLRDTAQKTHKASHHFLGWLHHLSVLRRPHAGAAY